MTELLLALEETHHLFHRTIEIALSFCGTPLELYCMPRDSRVDPLIDSFLLRDGLNREAQTELFSRFENVFDHLAVRSALFRQRYAPEPSDRALTKLFLVGLQAPELDLDLFAEDWRARAACQPSRSFLGLLLSLLWLTHKKVTTLKSDKVARWTLGALIPVEKFLTTSEKLRLQTLELRWPAESRAVRQPRLAKIALMAGGAPFREATILQESLGIESLLALMVD